METEAVYRYQPGHADSVQAARALVGVALDTPAVIGVFAYRDGGLVRISLEKDLRYRAVRLNRPPAGSAWQKFKYHLRRLFGLEGGDGWRVRDRGRNDIAEAISEIRAAKYAKDPAGNPAADTAAAMLPETAGKGAGQCASTAGQTTPAVAATEAHAAIGRASIGAPPPSPPSPPSPPPRSPLADPLANILPFLAAEERLHFLSSSRVAYNSANAERALALAIAHTEGVHTRSAWQEALAHARQLHTNRILTNPQYAELLAALARRIPFLPVDTFSRAFFETIDAVSTAHELAGWAKTPLIALTDVLRESADVSPHLAGSAHTDPLCRQIDKLEPGKEGFATPAEQLRACLALMRDPGKVAAVARRAWARLVPQPSRWLDAIADLHTTQKERLIPQLVAAATATRAKLGESRGTLDEIATHWGAMVEATLQLEDSDRVKGVALAALVRHWPGLGSRRGADVAEVESPAVQAIWDGSVWGSVFAATQGLASELAANVVAGLIATLPDLHHEQRSTRCEQLAHWMQKASLSAARRVEFTMAMCHPRFTSPPARAAAWCDLWDRWRDGPAPSDLSVGEALVAALRDEDAWCALLADKLTTAAAGLSAKDQARLLEPICGTAKTTRGRPALMAHVLSLAVAHGEPGPLLLLSARQSSLSDAAARAAFPALERQPQAAQARYLEALLRSGLLPTRPDRWLEIAVALASDDAPGDEQRASLRRALVRWYVRECAAAKLKPSQIHGVDKLFDRSVGDAAMLTETVRLADTMMMLAPPYPALDAGNQSARALCQSVWGRIEREPAPVRHAVLATMLPQNVDSAMDGVPRHPETVRQITRHAQALSAQRPAILARLARVLTGRRDGRACRELVWDAIKALPPDQMAQPLAMAQTWFQFQSHGKPETAWQREGAREFARLRTMLPPADSHLFK